MARRKHYIVLNAYTGENILVKKAPTPLDKCDLSYLKQLEATILKKLPSDHDRIKALYNEEIEKWEKIKEQRQKLQRSSDLLLYQARTRGREEYEKQSAIKKAFTSFKWSYTDEENQALHRIHLELSKLPTSFENKYSDVMKLIGKLSSVRRAIVKVGKKNTEKALIASHLGKSRDLAAIVKNGLKKQIHISQQCPYCGSVLGNDPHCDHIYPVSKGGLSRPENMVYICSACNLKKSDLTLSQFIQKYKLDRMEIINRLSKLGKDH